MIKIKYLKLLILAYVIFCMLFVLPVSAQFSIKQVEVPDFFNFGDDYYKVHGGPDVTATLIGNNEYSRGDEVTISINLMNRGKITGFESNLNAENELDMRLQREEMGYESQRSNALGISATLKSDDPHIRVKSGPQEAGSLASGDQTLRPLQFNIEIKKDAPTGKYPLNLSLQYDFQKNVQLSGTDHDTLGMVDKEAGFWYATAQQFQEINVSVVDDARFEVTNVTYDLIPGNNGLIYVTYKNVGEETAKNSVVRISTHDPFSTTDDQAFIGTLEPGDESVAVFNLNVNDGATPKIYAMNSMIKYEDKNGHVEMSDNIQFQVELKPGDSLLNRVIVPIIFLTFVSGTVLTLRKLIKKGKKNK